MTTSSDLNLCGNLPCEYGDCYNEVCLCSTMAKGSVQGACDISFRSQLHNFDLYFWLIDYFKIIIWTSLFLLSFHQIYRCMRSIHLKQGRFSLRSFFGSWIIVGFMLVNVAAILRILYFVIDPMGIRGILPTAPNEALYQFSYVLCAIFSLFVVTFFLRFQQLNSTGMSRTTLRVTNVVVRIIWVFVLVSLIPSAIITTFSVEPWTVFLYNAIIGLTMILTLSVILFSGISTYLVTSRILNPKNATKLTARDHPLALYLRKLSIFLISYCIALVFVGIASASFVPLGYTNAVTWLTYDAIWGVCDLAIMLPPCLLLAKPKPKNPKTMERVSSIVSFAPQQSEQT